MKHEEFKKLAIKMFLGQFPNEILMRVPKADFMGTYTKDIREELKEWVNVTIDKYKELVK